MRLTRRELAAAPAILLPAALQPQQPNPTPDDELRAARSRLQAGSAALPAVPMDLEPAFQFKP
jgi:hypothetical protein